mmetsp:Transcript_13544/g.29443  ORF Transcript_13544/g.29443 Transcript_13544/m.29443 type:complete len:86 (+) Transcript_13544:1568-1825(+)
MPQRPVSLSMGVLTMAVLPLCFFAFSDAKLWILTNLPTDSILCEFVFGANCTLNHPRNDAKSLGQGQGWAIENGAGWQSQRRSEG